MSGYSASDKIFADIVKGWAHMSNAKKTTRELEYNADRRAEVEKIIMELMNLQDDLVEKFISVERVERATTRDAWELRRRFSIVASSLRRHKEHFVAAIPEDEDYDDVRQLRKQARDNVPNIPGPQSLTSSRWNWNVKENSGKIEP